MENCVICNFYLKLQRMGRLFSFTICWIYGKPNIFYQLTHIIECEYNRINYKVMVCHTCFTNSFWYKVREWSDYLIKMIRTDQGGRSRALDLSTWIRSLSFMTWSSGFTCIICYCLLFCSWLIGLNYKPCTT